MPVKLGIGGELKSPQLGPVIPGTGGLQKATIQISLIHPSQLLIQSSGLLGYAALFAYGLHLVINHMLSLGTFVAFHTYSRTLSAAIDSLMSFKTNLQPLKVSLDRIVSAHDRYYEFIKDEEKKKTLKEGVREISVKNLSFSFGNIVAINNFSAAFKRGKIYGLVGPNGSGKTTLLRLLFGQLKASSGSVIINTSSIDELKYKSILARVSYIDSDKHLFHLTLKQNIASDLIDDFPSFINKYPFLKLTSIADQFEDGFETMMNDSLSLSSGQIQRVQIARALIRNSDVIFLDEAINNLDSEMKKEMKTVLKSLSKDRIIIFVSHIAEELDICDEILTLPLANGSFEG